MQFRQIGHDTSKLCCHQKKKEKKLNFSKMLNILIEVASFKLPNKLLVDTNLNENVQLLSSISKAAIR